MIVHQPELLKRNDHTIVYSKIEMGHHVADFPEYLWYRVPDQFAEYLSLRSDAFLIPSLVAGMYFREDIEVRGTVSPRLAYHLDEYQYLLHFRMPKAVNRVAIHYERLESPTSKPPAVGASFSGGVDSFFTIWKHLPQHQPNPDYQITHALFILGFDILNKDRERYQTLYTRYRQALQQLNIELIPLETNLVSLILPRMNYVHFYGPVLIGSAHVYGNLFQRFFVPSSRDYRNILVWTSSSDPTTDPLLSSESLDIIHHGARYSRVEKIEAISDWEIAQAHLRVCPPSEQDVNLLNCSRCEKCVRSMIPIYALGKMEKFQTFDKPFASNQDGLWWARKFDPSKGYTDEMIPFVRRVKPDLVPWLYLAAFIGYLRYLLLKIIPKPVQNWLKPFGFFVDPLKAKYVFEDLGVSEIIRSARG